MKRIIITSILATAPFVSNAQSQDTYFANIVYKDISFDWSIDNSHIDGRLDKESEIIWSTQLPVFEFGKEDNFSKHKIYIGMSNSGEMTDEDWHKGLDGSPEKWSSTISKADYFQIGYDYKGVLLRFRDTYIVDKIDIYTENGLQYEVWEGMGLSDRESNENYYGNNTKVITNKTFWFKSSLGLELQKQLGDFSFSISQQLGIAAIYNIDQHHLRNDLEDDSFVIMGGYGIYTSEANVSYKFDSKTSLNLGYKYQLSQNISDRILVNFENEKDGTTRLNTSTKTESSIYIGIEHKF